MAQLAFSTLGLFGIFVNVVFTKVKERMIITMKEFDYLTNQSVVKSAFKGLNKNQCQCCY